MAGCATSSTTSSAWCARRSLEREVLLRLGAAHHLAAALRAAAPRRPAARPVLRARPLPLRPPRRRRVLPPTRTLDLRTNDVGRAAASRAIAAPSSIRTAGSTMPASSCSTPATPPTAAPTIATRTRCVAARRREGGGWRLTLRDGAAGAAESHGARRWSMPPGHGCRRSCADVVGHRHAAARSRLVKGSHIVVERLFDHDQAYIFQNADGRICFAIPYERGLHPDRHHRRGFRRRPGRGRDHAPRRPTTCCAAASEYFATPGHPRPHPSGAMPACARSTTTAPAKAQEATRDYVLDARAPTGARAAALGLRRQDHHLPAPRRGGAGAARAAPCRPWARPGRKRRRCPAATSRRRRFRHVGARPARR